MFQKSKKSNNRLNLVGLRFGKIVVIEDVGNEYVGICNKTGKDKLKSIALRISRIKYDLKNLSDAISPDC